MRRVQLAALMLLLAGISSCGAVRPTKYYVLDSGPATASTAAQQFPVSLSVARVITSHLYRDDRLVYGSGPVQLGTYELERWAESPADMIQDTLVSYLRGTGQYRAVSRLGSASRGDYIVRSNLISFYEVDKPELLARFSMRVDLYDPKTGSVVWSAPYSHDEPVKGKTVPDVVEAMDRNVRAGMQQLSAELAQYFVDHPPQPPAAAK
ncbi:MAG: ABC-type transport auxiliary lipoprotein family protein [Candidatus Acidiferrales bacterium]